MFIGRFFEVLGRPILMALIYLAAILSPFFAYRMWTADRALVETKNELRQERETSAELRASIKLQTAAILRAEAEAATARGQYLSALEAMRPVTRKIDSLSAQISGMKKGVTCADAMPMINRALEGLK